MDIPVTFLVLTYNQEKYVEEAVVSALNQDYACLEIIISDDGSSDGTWDLIKKTVDSYTGRHEVLIRRNEINSGLATNFNNGIKSCRGEVIVVQAGDDISEPNRVKKLLKLWQEKNYLPDLLYSEIARMTQAGNIISIDTNTPRIPTVAELKEDQFFIAGGMSAAYTRRLFDKFGPLPERTATEDYVLTFRAILMGGIAHHPDPLVKYRIHEKSIMGQRRTQDKYTNAVKYASAAKSESWDRVRSWDISGHKDLFYRWKLLRYYFSASIFKKLIDLESIAICRKLTFILFFRRNK